MQSLYCVVLFSVHSFLLRYFKFYILKISMRKNIMYPSLLDTLVLRALTLHITVSVCLYDLQLPETVFELLLKSVSN